MKILALDDEIAALHMLERVIRAEEPTAELHTTTIYDEALAMAEAYKPEVVFLDISMGKHSGIEAARELKKMNPKINIIFVTGYSDYMLEAISLHTSGYVMKPADREDIRRELDNLIYPAEEVKQSNRVYVRTFGNFDLLVNDRPVNFSLSKAKEMLAYLIDRDGAAVSRKELASVLFEDREYSRELQDYLSKIYKALRDSLKAEGLEKLLGKGYNQYYVDRTAYVSDVDEYRQGKPGMINRFRGEYMKQYSWAEETLSQLYEEFHIYE